VFISSVGCRRIHRRPRLLYRLGYGLALRRAPLRRRRRRRRRQQKITEEQTETPVPRVFSINWLTRRGRQSILDTPSTAARQRAYVACCTCIFLAVVVVPHLQLLYNAIPFFFFFGTFSLCHKKKRSVKVFCMYVTVVHIRVENREKDFPVTGCKLVSRRMQFIYHTRNASPFHHHRQLPCVVSGSETMLGVSNALLLPGCPRETRTASASRPSSVQLQRRRTATFY
jgi:hypothetical protein